MSFFEAISVQSKHQNAASKEFWIHDDKHTCLTQQRREEREHPPLAVDMHVAFERRLARKSRQRRAPYGSLAA